MGHVKLFVNFPNLFLPKNLFTRGAELWNSVILFSAHWSQKLKWAIAVALCLSSVICKLFTFSTYSKKVQGRIGLLNLSFLIQLMIYYSVMCLQSCKDFQELSSSQYFNNLLYCLKIMFRLHTCHDTCVCVF